MSIKDSLEAIGALRRVTRMDAGAARRLQDQRLRELLRHAVARSPFYRRLYEGIDIERCALTDLPTTSKAVIQECFDEVVTEPGVTLAGVRAHMAGDGNAGKPYLGRFFPLHTSGTTGHSAVIVYDEAGLQMSYLVGMARRVSSRHAALPTRIAGLLRAVVLRQRTRIAAVVASGYGASGQTTNNVPRLYELFTHSRTFSPAVATQTLVDQLNEFQPSVIASYPNMVEVLALERLAGRLRVPLDGPDAQILTAGEPLTDRLRDLVRRAWDLEITDRYGLTECLVVAGSCNRFDGLHLMSDLCVVEPVDANDEPVPPGTCGRRILVTNLYNHVQPIIRYQVDDITGISTEPCPCGWPFPKLLPVQGRSLHAFHIDRPEGGYELVSPARFAFVFDIKGMRKFQVAQTERNAISFRYVPLPDAPSEPELRQQFETNLERAGLGGRLKVGFERCEDIAAAPSGKYLQFIREVPIPEG